jgi:hypothetical protein
MIEMDTYDYYSENAQAFLDLNILSSASNYGTNVHRSLASVENRCQTYGSRPVSTIVVGTIAVNKRASVPAKAMLKAKKVGDSLAIG